MLERDTRLKGEKQSALTESEHQCTIVLLYSIICHPLAIVVVGGLLTSILLTLIVVPTLYEWFEGRERVRRNGDVIAQ